MSKRYLITGGSGFIGTYIARQLITEGNEVILYDAFIYYVSPYDSKYNQFVQDRFKDIRNDVVMVRGNVRHKEYFRKTLLEYKPDIIIHLAALPRADISNNFSEEAIENNFVATTNCLEVIKSVDFVERFVYTSSSMIYGDFQYRPIDENHPKNPKDIYGATKYAGEILVETYGRRFGLEYTIIRPSAVYGPTDINRRVTGIFITNAFQKKPLILHNGGNSKLDFTFVEDTANGFVLASKSDKAKNEIFNITRGEGRSLKELANIISELVPDVEIREEEAEIFRPERGALDITKARNLLGYEPKYCLEDGMKIYVEYLKDLGIYDNE